MGLGTFLGGSRKRARSLSFATRSPHIFAWLNLHTFGGIFIRPPFSLSGQQVERRDLLVYDHVAEMMAKETGMSSVSAFKQRHDPRRVPPHDRDLGSMGIRRTRLFRLGRRTLGPLHRCSAYEAATRIIVTMQFRISRRSQEIRQLGSERQQWPNFCAVASIQSSPTRRSRNCQHRPGSRSDQSSGEGHSGMPRASLCCDHAGSLAPRVAAQLTTERIEPSVTKISLIASNSGYLPTSVTRRSVAAMESGLANALSMLRLFPCVRPGSGRVADLAGWGRGAEDEGNAPFFQKERSRLRCHAILGRQRLR